MKNWILTALAIISIGFWWVIQSGILIQLVFYEIRSGKDTKLNRILAGLYIDGSIAIHAQSPLKDGESADPEGMINPTRHQQDLNLEIARLSKLVAKFPQNADYWFWLGKRYYEDSRTQRDLLIASVTIDRGLAFQPVSDFAETFKGFIEFRRGNLDLAEAHLRAAIEAKQDSRWAYLLAFDLADHKKDYEKARSSAELAEKYALTAPGRVKAILNQTYSLRMLDKEKDAKVVLTRALTIQNPDPWLLARIANELSVLDEPDAAIKLLEENPSAASFDVYRESLAFAFSVKATLKMGSDDSKGDLDAAQKLIERSKAIFPDQSSPQIYSVEARFLIERAIRSRNAKFLETVPELLRKVKELEGSDDEYVEYRLERALKVLNVANFQASRPSAKFSELEKLALVDINAPGGNAYDYKVTESIQALIKKTASDCYSGSDFEYKVVFTLGSSGEIENFAVKEDNEMSACMTQAFLNREFEAPPFYPFRILLGGYYSFRKPASK